MNRDEHRRVVHRVAAACLVYPDEHVVAELPLLRSAVIALRPSTERDRLSDFLAYAETQPVAALAEHYVEVFDLSRKQTLYLSYWTDGDTRRRGEVLGRFKERYRASGLLVDTHGELTDYLPLVLEYAALADPVDGPALLQEYRASVELIRLGLLELGTPYAWPVEAVCATLPGASPADRAAVMAMASAGPPTEEVGLEAYDPRLLPLTDATRGG